ncbi:DUF536 domain-containing protein [Enterococcus faecium]|uniref:DUF536 domain-containing protein n=1 Tax=Enterococcus faecium TaxID=1352 RepID=UPI0039E38CBD
MNFYENNLPSKSKIILIYKKLLDQQQQLTLQANQQIEKLQEQLQLTYTEESSENSSTTLFLKQQKQWTNKQRIEKKWWQLWK